MLNGMVDVQMCGWACKRPTICGLLSRRPKAKSHVRNDGFQGEKGLPSEAGILTRIHCGLREISANTTMVAR